MSEVIIDPATLAKLSKLSGTVLLTDEAGHIVGRFVPAVDPGLRQRMEPQISEEELQRRERQGGGRPLSQILRDLEQRQ